MSEVKAKEHVCGLQGFNPMLGDNCEKCDKTKELLPCPFCGSEAATDDWYDEDSENGDVTHYFEIGCNRCDFRLLEADAAEIRRRWNTRANKTQ